MKWNKKGFTLVEIMVCLAIVGIVGVFLAGFLSPQVKIYNKASEQTDAKSICATVLNTIAEKTQYGRFKSVSNGGDRLDYTEVSAQAETEKTIVGSQEAASLFPDYDGDILVDFMVSGTKLTIVVTVYDADGNSLYKASRIVNSYNPA